MQCVRNKDCSFSNQLYSKNLILYLIIAMFLSELTRNRGDSAGGGKLFQFVKLM